MELNEVREFLTENKDNADVQAFLATLQPAMTAERAQQLLTGESAGLFKPHVDRIVEKAIKTHDEKQAPEIQKRIDAAVAGARDEGQLTAEQKMQKQLDEMQQTLKARDTEIMRNEIIATLRKEAQDKNVPFDLVIDTTNPNLTLEYGRERIELAADKIKADVDAQANAQIAGGHKPGSGNPSGDIETPQFTTATGGWTAEEMARARAEAEKKLAANTA